MQASRFRYLQFIVIVIANISQDVIYEKMSSHKKPKPSANSKFWSLQLAFISKES